MHFWKRLLIVFALLSLVLSFVSCSADSNYSTEESVEVSSDGSLVVNLPNRKIVYNVGLSFVTSTIASLKGSLDSKCLSLSGYTEKNDERYDDEGCTFVSVTYRIPTENLDEFLNFAEGEGKLTGKNVSTTDITTSYVNAEARLRSLEEKKGLLEKMLEDSTLTSSERLTIISEISDVGTEIEEIKLLINGYDSSVLYSTVKVNISLPTPLIEIIMPFIVLGVFVGVPIIAVIAIVIISGIQKKKRANH